MKKGIKSPLLLFVLILLFISMSTNALGAIADHVIISEVYYKTNDDSNSEFVELYNPTNTAVDISGWIINTTTYTNDATIPASSEIPAHGFFLIADSGWSNWKDNPGWSNADYEGEEITLANSNGGIQLLSSSGAVIDVVGWGSAGSGFYEDTALTIVETGNSSERISSLTNNENEGNGWDANNNSVDFTTRTTPQPQNSSNSTEHKANKIVCNDSLICDYTKIQSAIDGSSSGDVINVSAGTYDSEEFPIHIDVANLTIQSTGTAATTIINTSSSNHGAMNITANDVSIDGFTIYGGGNATNYDHVIDINADHITIQDNTIIGYNGNTADIHIAHDDGTGHLIKGNTLRHRTAGEGWGIFAENLTQSSIEDNLCYGNNQNWGSGEGAPGTCIIINDADKVTIKDNTAYDVKYSWLTFIAQYPRVDSTGYMYEDCRDANITNVAITDNTIYNINRSGSKAINFKPGSKGGQPGGWTDSANLTVNANVTIGSNNNFYSNSYTVKVDGISSRGSTVLGVDNLKINYNNIYDDADYGVYNGQSETINATLNYWGHATGPGGEGSGSGDNVSYNVDYYLWYTDSALTTLADTTTDYSSTIETKTITNLTQDDAAIQINVTLSNTGSASAPMYDAYIKANAFQSNFASASVPTQSCGTIPAGSSCTKTFDITINGGTTSSIYNIDWMFNWTNNDQSLSGNWISGSTITILDNSTITIVDAINKTIAHGINSTFSTEINSTGNVPLNNVAITYTASNLLSDWVVFSPATISAIAADSNDLLNIAVAIPQGTAPGDYTGTLTVSADSAASKQITLNVEVPTDESWNSYPSRIDTFRKTNVAGTVGTIYINNTGNIDHTYTILYSGAIRTNLGLWDLSNPTSINVPKQTTNSSEIRHKNYWQVGSYGLDVTVKVGFATNKTVMNLTLENDNPTLTIAAPINKSFVNGTVPFTVTASDLNLSTIKFYIDNTEVFNDVNLTKTFNWDTTSGSYPDAVYTLKATAFDSAGNSNTSTITVTVNNTDSAPLVVNQLVDFSFDEDTVNDSINLSNIFSSIDGESLTYSYTVKSETYLWVTPKMQVSIDQNTGIVNLTPRGNFTGSVNITFNATDAANNLVSDNITVTINNINDAPTIVRLDEPENGEIIISVSPLVQFEWDYVDVDFDDLTYNLYFSNDSTNLSLIATLVCEYDEEDIEEDIEFGDFSPCDVGDDEDFEVTDLVPNTTYYWTVSAFDGINNSGNASIFQFTYLQDSYPEVSGWEWNTSTNRSSNITDITISENESIEFNANITDLDGDEIEFEWDVCEFNETRNTLVCEEQIDDWELIGPIPINFTYTPGFDDNGTKTVRLIVEDNNSNSIEQDWNLTITNTNREPVLDAISTQSVDEDSVLEFNITSTDLDGDSLTFTSNITSILFTNAANNSMTTASWTPTNDYVGSNTINIIVSDGPLTDTELITITVTNTNDAPTITSFSPAENKTIAEGVGSQAFSVVSTDVDIGDSTTTTWFRNGTLIGSSASVIVTDLSRGIYNITVKVNDTLGLEDRHEWTLTVTTGIIFDGLTSPILEGLNQSQRENVTGVTINHSTYGGIDFGNKTMNFSKVASLEDAINISRGLISIDTDAYPELKNKSASLAMKGLNYTKAPLIYNASGFKNTNGNLCPEDICTDITYDVANGILRFNVPHFSTYYTETNTTNGAPIITSTPVTTAIERVQYNYDVDAIDPDGDTLTYSLTANPIGMSISSSSGVISWTPTINQLGENNVNVSVSDGSLTNNQSFQINVSKGPNMVISDLDIKVDGKTKKNVQNNTKIGKKAVPGSEIEFKIEIKNLFTDEEDLEIEDIEVEITIEGIDDGDDLEEDADDFDLRQGKNEDVKINFDIPLEVEEDIFNVIINAEGKDENGSTHEIMYELKLEVKKENHEIKIIRSDLTPSTIQCQRQVSINTEIINIGTKDEDSVTLEIISPELDINSLTADLELDEGTEDNRFTKTVTESISTDIEPGIYPITINSYYDNTLSESKTVDLTIEECELTKDIKKEVKEQKPEVEVIMPKAIIKEKTEAPVEISFVETNGYKVLLSILMVLFLGTAIVVVSAGYIVLKK